MSNRRHVAPDREPTAGASSESTDRSETHPALFIYIPTYNRPSKLRQQLDALAPQRGDWPGTVRILVNDNSSPSFSTQAAAAMEQEFGIEVRSNLGNVQANANIALAFVFGRPEEYLWILSDDDIVLEGALRTIATEGLVEDPDIITFQSTSRQSETVVHSWLEGWDWIGETGLISNVIYNRADGHDARARLTTFPSRPECMGPATPCAPS